MKKGNRNNTKVETWETVMWNSVFWTELDNCILELIAPVVKCRIYDIPAIKVYSKFIRKKKSFQRQSTIQEMRQRRFQVFWHTPKVTVKRWWSSFQNFVKDPFRTCRNFSLSMGEWYFIRTRSYGSDPALSSKHLNI